MLFLSRVIPKPIIFLLNRKIKEASNLKNNSIKSIKKLLLGLLNNFGLLYHFKINNFLLILK